jgi:hypothetical protein
VLPSAVADGGGDGPFYCPRCRRALKDCRRTRRASRSERAKMPTGALPADEEKELTDGDLDRCEKEWERTQEHLGRLGAMAESMWALDWADRLVAEVKRLRGGS